MARRKRSSTTLEKAQRRIASLKSINTQLDLGNGLTIEAYTNLIEETREKLEAYNTALSVIDQTYNAILQSEQSLAEFSERMLTGVVSKFGKSSDEYEMAGGKRRRERRRSSRQVSEPVV